MRIVKKVMNIDENTFVPEVQVTLGFSLEAEQIYEMSFLDEEDFKRKIGSLVLDKLKDFEYDQV